jgi:membrane associated rhomboid family serine protease
MLIEKLKQKFFYQSDILSRLIWVNIIVFTLDWFLGSMLILFQMEGIGMHVYKLLAVPSDIGALVTRPWTIFTYMFMHAGFFHLFWNMYIFYWFGEILIGVLGKKRFLPLYILCGLAGAMIYIVAYNVFPLLASRGDGFMVGASAAVMGVVMGAATIMPNVEIRLLIFGNIRLLYIALAILLLSSIDIIGSNAGGSFAHFGGAIMGYWLIKAFKEGNDRLMGILNYWNVITSWFYKKKTSKVKVRYRKTSLNKESKEIDSNRQEKLDKILDKISKSGYDSLSTEEKDFLFRISRKK